MDNFKLNQNRFSVKNEDGTLAYRIDVSCSVIRDDDHPVILTPSVFVYSTDTEAVPDVSSGGSIDGNFLRVATVADLDTLPLSKEVALATNVTEFRLKTLQLSMPDLETATNATTVIVDRVSTLVKTYITYQQNFYSNTQYDLPSSIDTTVVERYTSAYSNAVTSRREAQTEQDSIQTEYQLLQVKNEILDSYVKELNSFKARVTPFISAVESLSTEIIALTGEGSPSQAIKTNLATTSYGLKSMDNLLTAIITNRGALLTGSTGQEVSKLSELKEKQDELEALEAAESQALSDLAVFCPQVDPSQVD